MLVVKNFFILSHHVRFGKRFQTLRSKDLRCHYTFIGKPHLSMSIIFRCSISMALNDHRLKHNVVESCTEDAANHESDERLDPINLSKQESSCSTVPEIETNTVSLYSSLNIIPGLKRKHLSHLENCGFHTVRKLLHHFPRAYVDFRNTNQQIVNEQYLICSGEIVQSRGIRAGNLFSFLNLVVRCEVPDYQGNKLDDHDNLSKRTVFLHLKKFFSGIRFANKLFLQSIEAKYNAGDIVCVAGKISALRAKHHFEMKEFSIDVLKDKDLSQCIKGKPYALYNSKRGLASKIFRQMISRTLEILHENIDPIPKEVSQVSAILPLYNAYVSIHHPNDLEEAGRARRRLIFDEFFYLQLGRLYQMLNLLDSQSRFELLNRLMNSGTTNACSEDWSNLTGNLLKALPFTLTPSQFAAVSEIVCDLKRPVPMNRLLQGEVGCGKTVVAFLACMEVISSGYQAALMVPTELLAVQHYEHLCNLLNTMENETRPSVALLTGSTPLKESRMICKDIESGKISMVIGTHCLISENVKFSSLRIAVVDEQHRFGVIQRGRFNTKLYESLTSAAHRVKNVNTGLSMAPHVLAMSATPIPRSLALALYGNISLTQISDLPPGRIPVHTSVFDTNSMDFEDVYKMMLKELQGGGRIYVVYPVINLSEQLPQLRAATSDLETLTPIFQGYNCGLLHGRMKGEEKCESMRRFRSGETHILLSTQVVETGMDIPEASMMVVMNAERFGLAQLHQLRGRVGRGSKQSSCVLVTSTSSSLKRLKVLEQSSDGFYLANVDLLLRGPGDLLGVKQWGHLSDFHVARLEMDKDVMQKAHDVALKILWESHDLSKYPELKKELSMRQPLCLLGD